MAIAIYPDHIYSLKISSGKGNSISSVASTYKMPTVSKNATVSNIIHADLFTIDDIGDETYIGHTAATNDVKFPEPTSYQTTAKIAFEIKGALVPVWTGIASNRSYAYLLLQTSDSNRQALCVNYTLYDKSEGKYYNRLEELRSRAVGGNAIGGSYEILWDENNIVAGSNEFGNGQKIYIEVAIRTEVSTHIPVSVDIYISGNTVKFENTEKTEYGIENSHGENLILSENGFRQSDNKYDSDVYDFLPNNILSAYSQDRALAVIEVAYDTYSDTTGQVVINANNPVFNNGDVVRPYKTVVYRDNDTVVAEHIPVLTRKSELGKDVPSDFVVINNSISYRGGLPRQILYCIEKAHSSNSTYSLRDDYDTPNTVRLPDAKEK